MATNLPFDPAAFLDVEMDSPLEKRPPLPVGDYTSTIRDVIPKAWQKEERSGMMYEVMHTVEVPESVRTVSGLTEPTLLMRDNIFLDLTETGGMDGAPGKNRQLRNYRVALDMNNPGEPFRARGMIGRLCLIKVEHEVYKGAPVERIGGVAKLG